jgi:uncharacterized protein YcgI (DUF1989 family)
MAVVENPARKGKAARLRKGQIVKIINNRGQQVVDTWAFNAEDVREFMSMEHSRVSIGGILPKIGSVFVTNRRRPILTVVEDTWRHPRHVDRRLRPLPLRGARPCRPP